MKKRILSLLLALVMVLSLIPTLAFAAGEDNSKVTVYFSLSDNGKYKNGTSGKTLAYVPVTVEYFDLDDYGLGKYTRADAGEQPTVLHLFIKMLEQEYLNSGKLTVGGDALTVSGGAGSMYMTQFWGHDQNLTYYVNHVYPIMSGSTGATAASGVTPTRASSISWMATHPPTAIPPRRVRPKPSPVRQRRRT